MLDRILKLFINQMSHPLRVRASQVRRNRSVRDLDKFLTPFIGLNDYSFHTALDLGSGEIAANPFRAERCFGIDIEGNDECNILSCDLSRNRIPFSDNSISCVTAFDFIEHIPRVSIDQDSTRFPFIDLMNEIYRVLTPGGLFLSCTPAYPFKEVFQDPTHVNFITEDTFPSYFSRDSGSHICEHAKIYGLKNSFEIIDQAWLGYRLLTLLRK